MIHQRIESNQATVRRGKTAFAVGQSGFQLRRVTRA
jgi:hypothetical protein